MAVARRSAEQPPECGAIGPGVARVEFDVQRVADGREYRRVEQKPPPELSPLLARLDARAAA